MRAKLNLRFYIVSAILFGLVLFVWYGTFSWATGEVKMEDDVVMDTGMQMLFAVLFFLVAASWTMSLITLIRQIIIGSAFSIDQNGIHHTATAVIFLAFIFIVPVKNIPFEAISQITEENGALCVKLDRSKVRATPILKLFLRKEYRFFAGFTSEKPSTIKKTIDQLKSSR